MTEASATILQLITINDTGDSYYRMRWPARALASQIPNARVINLEAASKERLVWALEADLLVLYQSMDLDLIPVIEERRKQGKKTFVEYNDNFYEPQAWSPVGKEWSSPRIWYSYEVFMEMADRLLVTGPGLKSLFSTKCSAPITIIENHLPEPPEDLESLQKRKPKEIVLGWAGSLGHMADLLAIVPVIRELLLEIPELTFAVMGNEAIPSQLGVALERLRYTPWGSMDEYFKFWDGVHVGIAPLLESGYNRCRSDIKAVEMSARGVVPVLSSLLPYHEFIASTDAKSFTTFDEMKEVLFKLLANEGERRSLIGRCHEYVSTHRVGANRLERAKLYAEALQGVARSSFKWPHGVGYFEVQGTPSPKMEAAVAAEQAQKFIEAKQFEKATKYASGFRKSQIRNPEAWLLELRVLRTAGNNEFEALANEAAKRFPHELRFPLLLLDFEADRSKKEGRFESLLKRFRSESKNFKTFYGLEMAKFVARLIDRDPTLAPLGEKLLAILPNAHELRLHIAEAWKKTGFDAEALRHFTALSEMKSERDVGGQYLDTVERGYLEAWRLSLEARAKQSL